MSPSNNPMPLYRNPSQEQRIFELLRQRGPDWTGAPELSQISLQYCRAISCLRRRGVAIENKVDVVNGVRHGYYRLTQQAPLQTPCKTSAFADPQPESGLFSPSELSRIAKWEDCG